MTKMISPPQWVYMGEPVTIKSKEHGSSRINLAYVLYVGIIEGNNYNPDMALYHLLAGYFYLK